MLTDQLFLFSLSPKLLLQLTKFECEESIFLKTTLFWKDLKNIIKIPVVLSVVKKHQNKQSGRMVVVKF